jgi:uncharacterized damage-inducible protein DinB
MLDELFRYHDWANAKILALSAGLDDGQLDASKAMGFGSLRATLFHLVAAEEMWQDRMEGRPWAPLNTTAEQVGLDELTQRFREVAERRNQLLANERDERWQRSVAYRNTEGSPFEHRLGDLLTHVANHATHHRAQALNMLRDQARTVPGGLDYLFFKIAHPSIAQPAASREFIHKLQIEPAEPVPVTHGFDLVELRRYSNYGAWVMDLLFRIADHLPEEQWNRKFAIGTGSVRATLCHIVDAERWWLHNFLSAPGDFESMPDEATCPAARAAWDTLLSERAPWLDTQSDESLQEVFEGRVNNAEFRFRYGEILLQLCGHGTHHRAQLVNMFRQLERPAPPVDFVVWLRHGAPVPPPLTRAVDSRY